MFSIASSRGSSPALLNPGQFGTTRGIQVASAALGAAALQSSSATAVQASSVQTQGDPWNPGWQALGLGPDLRALLDRIAKAQAVAKAAKTDQAIVSSLKSSVLQQSETLVKKYYGLSADGVPLSVQLEPDMGNALASISYGYDSHGRMTGEVLHLSEAQFSPDASANATNSHVIQNDRIVAHEITHAIMGRNMDWSALPTWFKEGTAEYLAGGAERVDISLETMSSDQLAQLAGQNWTGSSAQYASSYLAIRFLDAKTQTGGGIKAVMAQLKAGDSLDTAIAEVSGETYAGEADFIGQWRQQASAFMKTIDLSGKNPGAIDGAKTGNQVVPDQVRTTSQPMTGFHIVWPAITRGSTAFGRAYGMAAYRQLGALEQTDAPPPVRVSLLG